MRRNRVIKTDTPFILSRVYKIKQHLETCCRLVLLQGRSQQFLYILH